MKKIFWLFSGIFAFCLSFMTIFSTTNVKADEVSYEVTGIGSIKEEKERLKRQKTYSELTPTQFYVKKGETINIEVAGDIPDINDVLVAVGTPGTDLKLIKYNVKLGINKITTTTEGPISLINRNKSGNAVFKFYSKHDKIPFFQLNKTTDDDFRLQMNNLKTAPVVQLVSKKALITVSYNSAQKYVQSPTSLMTYYDQFLQAQDEVSGLRELGREDYDIDKHLQHFVEANSGYMYATDEYMGFRGDAAMERLLKTNNGWGIWHESGHQRQLEPMTWGKDSVEVTVNIYSMAAQKAVTGRVSALDKEYPSIKKYLSLPNDQKNFDAQENYIKLGLYGQLMEIFGDQFYPQLHQIYRTMENAPKTVNEKKQRFIVETSNLVQLNLIPYFEKWGLPAAYETKKELNFLPELKEPIWESDNVNSYHLPLPQKTYVPELYYLKNSIKDFDNDDTGINVVFDSEWLKGLKYVIKKNGTYLGEVTDGKPYYGSGNTIDNSYHFHINTSIQPSDKFEVEVRGKGTYLLQSIIIYDHVLEKQLNQLFVDDSQTALVSTVTQSQLDQYLQQIEQSNQPEKLMSMYQKAQKLLLEKFIKNIDFTSAKATISFNTEDYKNYRMVLMKNGKYTSELNKGQNYYSSLSGLNWTTNVAVNNDDLLHLEVRLPDKTYILYNMTGKEISLQKELNDLYENGSIKETVDQNKLDQLKAEIHEFGKEQKEKLLKKQEQAQLDFLKNMIQKVERTSNDKLQVIFKNDYYKSYKMVMIKNGSYLAEVTNGSAYYSSIKNQIWTSNSSVYNTDTYQIEVRMPDKTYKIYTK
ncbi:M60 family metallopeptidase [Bacillus thuringiensis]|nr:M60 family metallopeptidase [Bacillus thuringiensis]